MQNHRGNTQPAISQEEHSTIGGVDGKKVFVIDNAGNQITSFGLATVTLQGLPTVSVQNLPYSYYQQSSLISGFVYYGFTAPNTSPATAAFKILRETLNTGEVLFGGGAATFVHTWSAASLASLSYL